MEKKGKSDRSLPASESTRLRIVEAAAKLFDAKGFDGTAVREIAREANVNLALISYYFQGKQGLLEAIISRYYESFIERLTQLQLTESWQSGDSFHKLMETVREYVLFQRDNAALTRIIQRELSVESMLAREVMTVYLQRLKHVFYELIEEGISAGQFVPVPVDHVLLTLSGMMVYPYLNPQSVREVYVLEPLSDEFCRQLIQAATSYLRAVLFSSPSVQ